MTVMASILAPAAASARTRAFLRLPRRSGFDRSPRGGSSADAPIPRSVVYPVTVAVSLLMWAALAWVVVLLLPLVS